MAIKVVVKNNNVEKALSIFKRKIKDSNLMYELREREYYKKPSVLKKEVKETRLMLELREREYYTKPSDKRKEKRAKARLRRKKSLEN